MNKKRPPATRIELSPTDRARVESAMAEFCQEREIEMSSLGMTLLVDFLQDRVGHVFYNRAVADASAQAQALAARLQDDLDLLRRI
ncbi:MAG TPA: DUF2164 family protein [Fibrobacteria bacterium]|nr:DUF2164 family protein [Fibrobacteria bacterium]HOX50289.1 DUF2164 family protein [Fibrobacteria bacterium]